MPLTIDAPDARSAAILERFRRGRPNAASGDIDLTLRPAYRDLMHRLGHPHKRMPPVFHVAGTNGKGSTCAFLRSILEAAGQRAHVYTSPHLVSYHERIRIAGTLIGEDELVDILTEIERVSEPGAITIFEAITAAAFVAFARHPADVTILETGLGGRLDSTNIVEEKRATVITRLSYDHREFLGDTLTSIAREKAGIMRSGVPCFTALQPDAESIDALKAAANAMQAPLVIGGRGWRVEPLAEGFRYLDDRRRLDLPRPSLVGAHQFENAGLAIAALLGTGFTQLDVIPGGLRNAEWPARLQRLEKGALLDLLPAQWELWLDGGHNDSAGAALGAQAKAWESEKEKLPLHLIVGMLGTKKPEEFLAPLAPHAASLYGVAIPDEAQSLSAEELSRRARDAGIKNAVPASDLVEALRETGKNSARGRVLICGSLYLSGDVLKKNAT